MKNAYLNDLQIHQNDTNIGYWLNPKIQGLEAPGIRLPSFERPNVDGAFIPNQLYGARPITLEGVVSGNGSLALYRTRRRAFEAVARIYRPGGVVTPITFKFKTMDDLELQIPVYVKKNDFPDILLMKGDYKLDLIAPDIRIFSQVEHTEQINIFQGGGMAIPMGIVMDMSIGGSVESVITNAGDITSFPTIIIRGPIDDPIISNQSSGDSFSLNYTLTSSAERIEIDIETRTVLYYADDTTAPINIRQYFSGDWWELQPGTNAIKLVVSDVSDAGYMVIKWRDAYLGV